ncbi:LysR family transcriptional regulator [Marmoricola endophyticus]|uniref:LysR family transcriptional regulator n=1 Tax=Marmoricola endophyticus TaxID=2040280 RepID=A0A917BCK7_9ACTN|nr:LysR family transcriptional regulator [Marmoricola endophyticus]GGF35728.1 LysR family transcriptional regulator [Marmoricola endophyticus]
MIDARLRVLRVVADRGTIAAAAEALAYTPSAVSHQMRTLARDVGAVLLEPEGRGVRLTRAARLLLERTDELFVRWEEIHAEVQRTLGETTGRLRLAGFSTAASVLLPPVVAAAHRTLPRTSCHIVEADPEVCFEMLLADRVDVAVVVATNPLPPSGDRRFEQHPLMVDSLELLVPKGHHLENRPWVRLADAAHEEWILDRPGRPYHQLTSAACTSAGFTPAAAHEIVEWDTCAALVAAGLGVALVPRLARLPVSDDVVRLPLRGDGAPVRHIRTIIRRGTSDQPEIALALSELQRVAASLA